MILHRTADGCPAATVSSAESLNLIQNGSDAMSSIDDRPRDMLVQTERDGHEALCLTVRDVGVPQPGRWRRLFMRFTRRKGTAWG